MHLKVIEIAGGFYHSVILLRQRNSEIPNIASDHCLINRQYFKSYKENQNENLKNSEKIDVSDLKITVEELESKKTKNFYLTKALLEIRCPIFLKEIKQLPA